MSGLDSEPLSGFCDGEDPDESERGKDEPAARVGRTIWERSLFDMGFIYHPPDAGGMTTRRVNDGEGESASPAFSDVFAHVRGWSMIPDHDDVPRQTTYESGIGR